jgi:prepilin-type N-terminal cleavage/methylation domain-containing protein
MSRFNKERFKNSRGFTLIEVIVSLIVAGILGAMLVSFMGTNVVKSADPVIIARNGAYLNSIIENMTTDYKYEMATALKDGDTPTDGLNNFKTNLSIENKYGTGYEVDPSMIDFTESGEETSGDILKVTVTYQGLSATALFTE